MGFMDGLSEAVCNKCSHCKNINEVCQYSGSYCLGDFEKVYDKAIDDFVSALEKLDKKRKGIGIDIIDVFEVSEQLKETKNG